MKSDRKLTFYFFLSIELAALLVLIVLLWLTHSEGSQNPAAQVAAVPVELFRNDHSRESSALELKKYYGLEPEMYEEAILYFPVTNMDAEELLIIRLADSSQSEIVAEAIRERNQTQKNVYEGYAPKQFSLCENAVIDIQGNYILYVVHDNALQIDEAFREAL